MKGRKGEWDGGRGGVEDSSEGKGGGMGWRKRKGLKAVVKRRGNGMKERGGVEGQ